MSLHDLIFLLTLIYDLEIFVFYEFLSSKDYAMFFFFLIILFELEVKF